MMPTSEANEIHNNRLKCMFNVKSIEFSNDREFSGIPPDKITKRICDGKVIGEDYHYHPHVKWVISIGKKYQGLLPIETKKCSRKNTIIPFFWITETEWEELDDNKMMHHLREMIDSSRKY